MCSALEKISDKTSETTRDKSGSGVAKTVLAPLLLSPLDRHLGETSERVKKNAFTVNGPPADRKHDPLEDETKTESTYGGK